MHLRGIVAEDFVNYKKPSMFLITPKCNWKCCIEKGLDISICQNNSLVNTEIKWFDDNKICDLYMSNPITKAIVFGGLEPFEEPIELINFIEYFRRFSDDDIVIYTGYYEKEISCYINELKRYSNIIIKFGRYAPGHEPHYDEVLGVNLASMNQYAKKIS